MYFFTVNNQRLQFSQRVSLYLKSGNLSWDVPLLVAPKLPYPINLGCNFFYKTKATMDFKIQMVLFPYATPQICFISTESCLISTPNSFQLGSNLTSHCPNIQIFQHHH